MKLVRVMSMRLTVVRAVGGHLRRMMVRSLVLGACAPAAARVELAECTTAARLAEDICDEALRRGLPNVKNQSVSIGSERTMARERRPGTRRARALDAAAPAHLCVSLPTIDARRTTAVGGLESPLAVKRPPR